MNNSVVIICLAIFVYFEGTKTSWSADFDKGLNAARSGDFATALSEWGPLAERGNPTAQINLGVMYEDGMGVIKDYKRAAEWYRLAAIQGDTRAQVNLGLMYANGTGVTQNNLFAYMWWNIASSSGDEDAASNRDMIAKLMTAKDISAAQELSRECIQRSYKGCRAQVYEN